MSSGEQFFLVAGDLLPLLDGALTTDQGDSIPLSRASSVALRVRPSGIATQLFSLSATYSLATAAQPSCGHVTAIWTSVKVPTVANFYQGQFVITYDDARTQRIPNPGFIGITVGTAIV